MDNPIIAKLYCIECEQHFDFRNEDFPLGGVCPSYKESGYKVFVEDDYSLGYFIPNTNKWLN